MLFAQCCRMASQFSSNNCRKSANVVVSVTLAWTAHPSSVTSVHCDWGQDIPIFPPVYNLSSKRELVTAMLCGRCHVLVMHNVVFASNCFWELRPENSTLVSSDLNIVYHILIHSCSSHDHQTTQSLWNAKPQGFIQNRHPNWGRSNVFVWIILCQSVPRESVPLCEHFNNWSYFLDAIQTACIPVFCIQTYLFLKHKGRPK